MHANVSIGRNWTAAKAKSTPLSWNQRVAKRAVDLVGASLGLIILLPVMLLVAVAVKCSSKEPVFVRQTRHGFSGQTFRIARFRTMSVLADGPAIVQARRNEPRATPLGTLLRETGLDELLQLFNVLCGDMSLVGPRLHAVAHNDEHEKLIRNEASRLHVKPGITGWAQISGYRGETGTVDLLEKRVELDLWYVNNSNFWLDLKILMQSLFIFMRTENAD